MGWKLNVRDNKGDFQFRSTFFLEFYLSFALSLCTQENVIRNSSGGKFYGDEFKKEKKERSVFFAYWKR